MVESRRLESHQTHEAADRDSRAEALLVEGLDRYFAGQYEEAIHVWTRVLFLDRSHARARAYIDRGRTALAERQRQAEELLYATGELLAQGRTDQARDLLSQAAATAGDDERVAELRVRLERIERALGQPGRLASAAVVDAVPIRGWGQAQWSVSRLLIGLGSMVAVIVVTMAAGAALQEWVGFNAASQSLPPVSRTAPLHVMSSSEVALVRARTLFTRGRLADALRALDRIDADSPDRSDADRLRVEIQHILLATRRASATASGDRGSQ
jgi:tetratricopeptide (TPR) repeat protein